MFNKIHIIWKLDKFRHFCDSNGSRKCRNI